MSIELEIKAGVASALKTYDEQISGEKIALQPTRKEFPGTFTFVTFPWAGKARKSPEQVGEEIGGYLQKELSTVSGFNVVKGFLNIEINQGSWVDTLASLLADEDYGKHSALGENVMVEYSSPNTNKPLHLGHLRNNFLGYAVSQILIEAGYGVTMANLVNDRGIHICKSMLGYLHFADGKTPEEMGVKGDRLVGDLYVAFEKAYKDEVKALMNEGMEEDEAKKKAPLFLQAQEMLQKWEQGDPAVRELWEKMNGWVYAGFDATYELIGVNFDKFYYESDTYLLGKDLVEEGLASGTFFKKENGSVWCDLSQEGLDEKLVLRSDGTSVYITQDMGTADLKDKDFKLNKSVYVVGNEQDYHFQVLKLIMQKLGRPYADGIHHMSYGMVDLPSGRMKTREGNVVDADDLVGEMIETAEERTKELGKIENFESEEAKALYRQLALGALKYYILKVDPKKRMVFNPEESIDFQGDTGVFIQYSHARISSILRKAKEEAIDYHDLTHVELEDSEIAVLEHLNAFPKKIKDAAENYAPSTVAQYTFELARLYSRFFAECSIFQAPSEEVKRFRVALSYVVGRTIKKGLGLLGIESPERM